MLTPRERALLFRACSHHPVARCQRCAIDLKGVDLCADEVCPSCRVDFTTAIRDHLLSCAAVVILSEVVADAKALRRTSKALGETSVRLRKEAQQLCDATLLAQAEREATLRGGVDPAIANDHLRGWDIEPHSYRAATGGWRPKAFVIRVVAGSFRTRALAAPIETVFDSEIEANDYAVAMAKTWIGNRST